MKVLSYPRSLSLLCLLATFTLLSGCAANLVVPDTVITTPTGTGTGDIQGNVYGGRQPIQGAHLYLYGAANTGYGAAGISLLGNISSPLSPDAKCDSSVVAPLYYDGANCYYLTTTGTGDGNAPNPGGEFNLTGLYMCNVTASGASQMQQQVWLYSVGGSPGVVKPTGQDGTTIVNPAASLTAALGQCPTSNNFSTAGNGALSYVYVNEVSTVAFAYAVAGFASPTQTNAAQYVGAKATHYIPNLSNAFANAAQLYDIQGGADPGDHGARQKTPSGNGTTPYLLINTIADAMSTCINSNNSNNTASPSSACTAFFDAAYGTTNYPSAAETASAAIYLAQHPGESTATSIFTVPSSEAPWLPNFNFAGAPTPSDATAAITFMQLNSAYGVVIDASGNAFVTENNSTGYIVKLPSAGPALYSTNMMNSPSYITIDSAKNLWSTGLSSNGSNNGVLYEISSTTLAPVGASPFSVAIANTPLQIAADTNGYVYIADYQNNDILKVQNSTPPTTTAITNPSGCTAGVQGIAYSGTGTKYPGSLWITGSGSPDVCDITNAGASKITSNSYAEAGQFIAVDNVGDSFVTAGDSGLYETLTSGSRAQFVNTDHLQGAGPLAIDGANNAWILNTNASSGKYSLVEVCTASSCPSAFVGPNVGFQSSLLNEPQGIAIDGSGDIWIANFGNNNVKELIGAAVPVLTPLSSGTGLPNVVKGAGDE